jgi:DNA ligase-1
MPTPRQVLKGPNEIVPFDHSFIQYPQLASTKFDGFRCLNLCGEHLLSPALKEIPNANLRTHLAELLTMSKAGLVTDGELWSPKLTFQELQSIIRSYDKPIPEHVGYYIFDLMTAEEWDDGTENEFLQRYIDYKKMIAFPHVVPVEQWHIRNAQEAEDFFNGQLELSQEGMILRQPHARYKHGRATTKQDFLWKFKEFVTHDAMIVGVEEQMRLREGVERTRNIVGHLERRYEQELYEPAGKVGAFIVEHDGQQFKVKPGKGQNDYIKTSWWNDWKQYPEKWRGKHVEYKHMPHGAKDKPRIGSLVRFRPDLD